MSADPTTKTTNASDAWSPRPQDHEIVRHWEAGLALQRRARQLRDEADDLMKEAARLGATARVLDYERLDPAWARRRKASVAAADVSGE